VLTLKNLYLHYQLFKQTVCDSVSINSTIGAGFYLRLMALVSHEIVINVPVSASTMAVDLANGEQQFRWNEVHSDWSYINRTTYAEWITTNVWLPRLRLFQRWLLVYWAFSFFGFFGFTPEVRGHYSRAYRCAARRLGLLTADATTVYASLLRYIHRGSD